MNTTRVTCIIALLLSIISLTVSVWTATANRNSIREEVYNDIVQELDSVMTPWYKQLPIDEPSEQDRKTVKGLLQPLFKLTKKSQ